MKKPRKQCSTCPWRVDVDPNNIPRGYGHVSPQKLARAVESGELSLAQPNEIGMGCHSDKGVPLPCVGWLVHQLGPGNNFAVRLKVMAGRIDGNVATVGEQRDLPRELLRWGSGGSGRDEAARGEGKRLGGG